MTLLALFPFWFGAGGESGEEKTLLSPRSSSAVADTPAAADSPGAHNWAGVRPHDQAHESALVSAIQGHDPDALGDLYSLYYGELLSYGQSIVSQKLVVEDVIQNVFLRVWIRRAEGIAAKEISYYLYGAVRRGLLQAIRNDRRIQHAKSVIGETAGNATSTPLGTSSVEANELAAVLMEAIKTLPDRCREVFELSRLGQLSRKEIAHMLGISENTVKTQLSRALTVIGQAVEAFDSGSIDRPAQGAKKKT